MRPQDIPVLLKMICSSDEKMHFKDLAQTLFISSSEISESLNRSRIAGLVNHSKVQVNRKSFFEFIQYGFKYVFPAVKGPIAKGFPTSSGHEFMQRHFSVNEICVWPDLHGTHRGPVIEPLYPNQVKAALHDPRLYKLLALLDVLRLEKLREVDTALQELKKEILE